MGFSALAAVIISLPEKNMGINEEIAELNRKVQTLTKKQEEFKKLLAVEEHKVEELLESLKEEGYDVAAMTEEEILTLSEKLMASLETNKTKLTDGLAEVEKLYAKLEALR
jgi:predicted transcriptional regulator